MSKLELRLLKAIKELDFVLRRKETDSYFTLSDKYVRKCKNQIKTFSNLLERRISKSNDLISTANKLIAN